MQMKGKGAVQNRFITMARCPWLRLFFVFADKFCTDGMGTHKLSYKRFKLIPQF